MTLTRRSALRSLGGLLASAPWLSAAAAASSSEDLRTLAAGTRLYVRLLRAISTRTAKENDAVEVVLLMAVPLGDLWAFPMRSTLQGTVAFTRPPAAEDRAALTLSFTSITPPGSEAIPIQAQVLDVDNARETVDQDGRIMGILATETLAHQMDQGMARLSERFAKLSGVLGAARGSVVQRPDLDISYDAGTDLVLELVQPVRIPLTTNAGFPDLQPIEPFDALYTLVNTQPFQTYAEKPPKPSDITNLMFLGTAEQISKGFTAAGWTSAAELSGISKWETFRSIAENRGYHEAPMSILLLDGKKPEMELQKQTNTFAERHHLRIFKRPVEFAGRQVWVSSSTQDTGIEFSPENKTFIHLIDPKIDRERGKIVNDLLFAGVVKGVALVDRPEVPKESENATGDKLITDGCMAVVMF
jgi:hypothetical protein